MPQIIGLFPKINVIFSFENFQIQFKFEHFFTIYLQIEEIIYIVNIYYFNFIEILGIILYSFFKETFTHKVQQFNKKNTHKNIKKRMT